MKKRIVLAGRIALGNNALRISSIGCSVRLIIKIIWQYALPARQFYVL